MWPVTSTHQAGPSRCRAPSQANIAVEEQQLPTCSGRNYLTQAEPESEHQFGHGVDSTDAARQPELSTGQQVIQGTLVTRLVDSSDATPGYPGDSTDETNNLEQIAFK